MLVFGLVISCGPGDDEGTTAKVTLNSVTADGSATEQTTKLTLVFSAAIEDLEAADISVTGTGITVTKGALSGDGPSYTLAIDFNKSGKVTVTAGTKATGSKEATLSDPFEFYYQKFDCTYDKTKNITEALNISKKLIKFTDNEQSKTTAGAADDFIDFTVSKWEFLPSTSLPTFTGYTGNGATSKTYSKGIKVTGKITDAQPPKATDTADTTQVYGTNTCPGIKKSDIGVTEVYIYLYFTEEDDPTKDFTYLARSAFFANPAKTGVTVQNPLTTAREYKNSDL